MATHSSILAWRIPGMAEPGGLPFMGLHRVSKMQTEFLEGEKKENMCKCAAVFQIPRLKF